MEINKDLHMRPLHKEDLQTYWELVYKQPHPEWKKWDAPYYPHEILSYNDFLQDKASSLIHKDNRWGLFIHNQLIGAVSYYWEHQESNWLEAGIAIYDSNYWNGGYGTLFLKHWIDHLFKTLPLVRVGFTTWSGNLRMMRLGEKLGMTLEGRLRKCRLYQGVYYDSIRMGILREEWEKQYAMK
ncbi:GNAT family N-acetyltransferase [Bacillus sp. WMMC1349]|uniref:GNAT family N-acetyltransferase n=1 Tax=Bacillus sp. WMMC1349 TaxID=2736254 RepID=UPI001552F85B|nr:GNAT family protein [Bacillus sp. WMMC1349]NPC94342.1 GNAT family N-acetyltransferase [Bacillus sp. WMMC1349]